MNKGLSLITVLMLLSGCVSYYVEPQENSKELVSYVKGSKESKDLKYSAKSNYLSIITSIDDKEVDYSKIKKFPQRITLSSGVHTLKFVVAFKDSRLGLNKINYVSDSIRFNFKERAEYQLEAIYDPFYQNIHVYLINVKTDMSSHWSFGFDNTRPLISDSAASVLSNSGLYHDVMN